MYKFIEEQSKKASQIYNEEKTQFDEAIKKAVKQAAEHGLNHAVVCVQTSWYSMEIIKKYLQELGCRDINGSSNYSWKIISFDF